MVGQELTYRHPIPFNLPTYTCYRVSSPLVVDGVPNETSWAAVPWTDIFQDITGDKDRAPQLRTRAKMLWDHTCFYIAAELQEPHVWATLKERDAIMYQNDNFEVFIDPDGDGQHYYEFEINAFNALWDLLMLYPYREKRYPNYLMNWQAEGIQTATFVSGTLNDPTDTDYGWFVEMAIPWSALAELNAGRQPPQAGDKWRVNFSRVDWEMEVKDGKYVKKQQADTGMPPYFPAENWVWSPTGYVDMHRPECFGIVHFSSKLAGEGKEEPVFSLDESIRWGLWQLFYLQNQYRRKNHRYADDLRLFSIPAVDIPGYIFEPQVAVTPNHFEIWVRGIHPDEAWYINDGGRIWLEKRKPSR